MEQIIMSVDTSNYGNLCKKKIYFIVIVP